MSSGAQQQNPDGSWSEAVPLGWQGPENQVDFEVERVRPHDGSRRWWHGRGFLRADHVHTVQALTRPGLYIKARAAAGWRTPVTFLWDPA